MTLTPYSQETDIIFSRSLKDSYYVFRKKVTDQQIENITRQERKIQSPFFKKWLINTSFGILLNHSVRNEVVKNYKNKDKLYITYDYNLSIKKSFSMSTQLEYFLSGKLSTGIEYRFAYIDYSKDFKYETRLHFPEYADQDTTFALRVGSQNIYNMLLNFNCAYRFLENEFVYPYLAVGTGINYLRTEGQKDVFDEPIIAKHQIIPVLNFAFGLEYFPLSNNRYLITFEFATHYYLQNPKILSRFNNLWLIRYKYMFK